MPVPLLIGSSEPFSGKSAVALGLGRQLLRQGVSIRFGKPLATLAAAPAPQKPPGSPSARGPLIDDDTRFIGTFLGLAEHQLIPSLHSDDPLVAHQRLMDGDLEAGAGFDALRASLAPGAAQAEGDPLVMLEGAGSLSEGLLFGLSLPQVAHGLEAQVVLVHPWRDSHSVDPLLAAQRQLGDRLAGLVLNRVIPDEVAVLREEVAPALERLGLPVLGILPRSPLLGSMTVEEISRRLHARVLCCSDRLDLLVETLSIGAMNVNSAMEFFKRRRNMAVITGADRTDIQLAALEASTQCLILTGVGEPLSQLINRAEELEVPVLRVDHDTLTTVEVIEAAIGHVRLQESVKATYAVRLVEENCRFARLYERLRLPVRA
jgi:BioD-like phosphotransacetylase family protein